MASTKSYSKFKIFKNLTEQEKKMIVNLYLYDRIISAPLAHKYYFSVDGEVTPKTIENQTYRRLRKLCQRKVLKIVKYNLKTENENIYTLDRVGLFCVLNLLNLNPNIYDGEKKLIKKNHRTLADLEISKRLYEHQLATIYTRLACQKYLSEDIETMDLITYSNKFPDNFKIPDLYMFNHKDHHSICFEIDMSNEGPHFLRSSISNYLTQIEQFYNRYPDGKVSIVFIVSNDMRIPISREFILDQDPSDILEKNKPYQEEFTKYNKFCNSRLTLLRDLLLEILQPALVSDKCNVFVHELIKFSKSNISNLFNPYRATKTLKSAVQAFYNDEISKGVNCSIHKGTSLQLGTITFNADLFYQTYVKGEGDKELPCYLMFCDYSTGNLKAIAQMTAITRLQSYVSSVGIVGILIVETEDQIYVAQSLIPTNKMYFILKRELLTNSIENSLIQYANSKMYRVKLSLISSKGA